MPPRYAARRDSTETPIRNFLVGAGATVVMLSADNLPDLLIGWQGKTLLAEVKSEKGKLRKGQEEFIEKWHGSKIYILRSIEDAIAMLNEQE